MQIFPGSHLYTKCYRCLLPIPRPHSHVTSGHCECQRCPGCLMLNSSGLPCSEQCSPWFPPLFVIDGKDSDIEYHNWVLGKPIDPSVYESMITNDWTFCRII